MSETTNEPESEPGPRPASTPESESGLTPESESESASKSASESESEPGSQPESGPRRDPSPKTDPEDESSQLPQWPPPGAFPRLGGDLEPWAPEELLGRPRGWIGGEFRLLGVLAIAVGFLLLLEQAGVIDGVHRLWPVFQAAVGLGLILLFARRKRDLVLLGIGSYLLVSSAVFFVCNYTTWDILAHSWPLFVALLGVTSAIVAVFADKTRRVLWLSGLFLNIVAIVLFLVFTVNTRLWPLSLVLFGAWILLVTRARRSPRGDHD